MAVRKVNVNGVVYDVEDKEGVEANAQEINNLKSGAEAAGIAHKLASGMVYRGYINEGTTLPSDDNSFYLTNDPGNYIDREGNAVTVTTEGVSLILRKGGEWRVYNLWELVSELNNASRTRFASAYAVKKLKDMIDQLAAQGGGSGGGSVIVDSELSETSLNPVQNAVITAALNELVEAIEEVTAENSVTTDKIADYAVTEEKLSFELSNKIDNTKIVADKAAADIGADSTTLLQGGIDSDGKENASSYYLRTGRYSTFKLEVNNGYTVGQLAQYDLSGNFVALYSDYTQPLESVEWNPQSVVATDKNYSWVAIVFKGNSPSTPISPREDVVKTFVSGLHYYMQGGEDDANSAAAQAKAIIDNTIEKLPNEEDLTLVDGKMQMANRAAAVKDGKVANLGYVILRKDKSFAEQVAKPNCIYEIRYEFDLNDKEVEIPANCALKFNGGKLSNGRLAGSNLRFDYYDSNGDGDSLPDLIDMLENCLPISYTGGTVTSFINIYLGYGRYVIDRPIRFKNYGKRFALIGKGVSKTTVEVTIPDEEIENVAAFVNKKETIDGVTYHGFGFSTFKDILFEGGSKQVFMDVDTGTDYGVPQNFKFVDCAFTKFKRIVRTKGDIMASEFFFRGTNIYAMDENSIAFEFDNHESVNFMFSQCCIESLKGKLFYVNKGTFINVQQSSIIMEGSNAALVYTEETSQTNTLTMGTIFDGCRFEIRNGAKLLDLHNKYRMYVSIVNCRSGINISNSVAMTLGISTHLQFIGNDSIGQTSIVELSNTAATQYQGVIITDNKSLFNAVMNSETFKQMAPTSTGITYRIIYNGKVYKLPYDYPSAALSEDGKNTYDNSEIKSESISFTYQKGGITDLYPYDSEEKRVVTRNINRFITDLQVVLKKSSQIGGYKYRLEFELLKSDTVVKSFTIENKGSIEKIVRVYVGEEIDTIKCTRYNDDITTGSARRLIGYININYR